MTSVDDVINANVVEENLPRDDARPAIGSPDDPRGGG